jgi:hypothetical protein
MGVMALAVQEQAARCDSVDQRNKKGGEFMTVKKPARKKKAASKFKGLRREKS